MRRDEDDGEVESATNQIRDIHQDERRAKAFGMEERIFGVVDDANDGLADLFQLFL